MTVAAVTTLQHLETRKVILSTCFCGPFTAVAITGLGNSPKKNNTNWRYKTLENFPGTPILKYFLLSNMLERIQYFRFHCSTFGTTSVTFVHKSDRIETNSLDLIASCIHFVKVHFPPLTFSIFWIT